MQANPALEAHRVVSRGHAERVWRAQQSPQEREHAKVCLGRLVVSPLDALRKAADALDLDSNALLPRVIVGVRAAQHARCDAAGEMPQEAALEHAVDAWLRHPRHLLHIVLARQQRGVEARVGGQPAGRVHPPL